ncbi:putative mitochondrial protein [Andalucia godoyi]|uniref:Putative mitochondrial protein n=1 Tax=Andalucia godoyi TaxID=505711 RepID=A0A8K0AJB1_ANDGO|nr:putative mitochondrial protein [Andalucia godoyi]|eukprot:ANDGO_07248.mRNA.1 putative mitochondrial protein
MAVAFVMGVGVVQGATFQWRRSRTVRAPPPSTVHRTESAQQMEVATARADGLESNATFHHPQIPVFHAIRALRVPATVNATTTTRVCAILTGMVLNATSFATKVMPSVSA